jgi:hypothetical protein
MKSYSKRHEGDRFFGKMFSAEDLGEDCERDKTQEETDEESDKQD